MFSTINIFDSSEGEIISILCWEKFAFLWRSTFLILYENLSGDLIFYRSNSLQHQLTGCGPKVAISCFFPFLFVIFYWSNFEQNEVGGFWARLKQLGPLGGGPRWVRGVLMKFERKDLRVFSTSRLSPLALSSDWILAQIQLSLI